MDTPELLATHSLPFWKEATFAPSVYENNLLGLQSCADKCGMAAAGGLLTGLLGHGHPRFMTRNTRHYTHR